MGQGFELRTLHLQSRHSTAWAPPPVPFCSGSFGDGVLRTICPSWSQSSNLQISASKVARIIGMSHCGCLELFNLGKFSHSWTPSYTRD
jgi:hypothetical protein